VGFAGYVAGYGLLAVSHSLGALMAATTVCAIGGLVRPTLTSLITQAAPRDEQGVVLGLTQSLTSVSQIVGPLLAGWLIQHNVLTGWGLVAAAVSLIGLLLAFRSSNTPTIDT
jgi:MFS family permease